MLRKLAWLYTAGFLGIFLICHTPVLTDDSGRLPGLFRIDPIDDVVHLLSGPAGAIIAWRATALIRSTSRSSASSTISTRSSA